MVAEVACVSKPMTVIPMVVTNVQGLIAAGQVRASDQLIDAQQVSQPGTLTVYLEPMFDNGFEGVPPGSTCIANAYTSNYDRLDSPDVGTVERLSCTASTPSASSMPSSCACRRCCCRFRRWCSRADTEREIEHLAWLAELDFEEVFHDQQTPGFVVRRSLHCLRIGHALGRSDIDQSRPCAVHMDHYRAR